MRSPLACLLAASITLWSATGCTSLETKTVRNGSPDPMTAAIDVRVFDRASDVKAGHPTSGRVTSELETVSGESVHRAEDPHWTLGGLQPGRYRLTIRHWSKGSTRPEPDTRATDDFTLHPGDRIGVEVVARKVKTGAVVGIAAGVAGAVAIGVALSAAKKSVEGMTISLAQRQPTEPLPLGEAASLQPGRPLTPSPAEFEELARTVARAFPE